jgi:hypothetical protein
MNKADTPYLVVAATFSLVYIFSKVLNWRKIQAESDHPSDRAARRERDWYAGAVAANQPPHERG